MKSKKLLSLLLTGAMALSAVPQMMVSAATSMNTPLVTKTEAMEGYGNYGTVDHSKAFGNDKGIGTATNAAAYSFTVTGTKGSDSSKTVTNKLTILDRDADGNYLVIKAESENNYPFYGKHGNLENEYGNITTELEEMKNKATTKSSDFHYDPTNVYSIAWGVNCNNYWQILNNGVGGSNPIPKEMREYLIEKTWDIEPETVRGLSTETYESLSEDLKTEYDAWLANRDNEKRTVTAKVVIPSASELVKYGDKIDFGTSKWDGGMTRTLGAKATYVAETTVDEVTTPAHITYENCYYNLNTNNRVTYMVGVGSHVAPHIMFWLDKDFFKNYKVDLTSIGDEAKKQINQYTANQLTSLYTDSELETLGYTVDQNMKGFGTYSTIDHSKAVTSTKALPAATNNATYSFTVKGTKHSTQTPTEAKLTILDRDDDGNYLVIKSTDETQYPFYGKASYDANLYGSNKSDFDAMLDKATTKSSDFHYDPEISNSVAAGVNNFTDQWGVLNNGVGGARALPKEIQQYMVEKTWDIEPEYVDGLSTATYNSLSEELKAEYDAWLANRDNEMRTVTAKVVIPSASELVAYGDKIDFNTSAWDGGMTRTLAAKATYVAATETAEAHIEYANLRYNYNGGNRQVYSPLASYAEQPHIMFWLDKDFFKKYDVEIDDTLGDVAKKQITQYDLEDIQDLYTFGELTKLGYDVDPAMEGYGNYPKAQTIISAKDSSFTGETGTSSPAENVFYVNDENGNERSFILLDRDNDGNYFVMTEEYYGTHGFTSLSSDYVNSLGEHDDEGDFIVIKGKDWQYDPKNSNSVAYYLENDFLTSGADGKVLPKAIKDKLVEKTWTIENNYFNDKATDSLSTSTIATANKTRFSTWKKDNVTDERTVTAKIALPSYSEYMQYHDKIRTNMGKDDWAGCMTRTSWSTAEISTKTDDNGAETQTIAITNKFFHIRTYDAAVNSYLAADGAMWSSTYKIRPVFWLKSDFFKTVKVNAKDGAFGENVAKQIKAYNTAEELLTLGYTEAEVSALGFKIASVSDITFADANGNVPESLNGLKEINAKITVSTADDAISRVLIIAVYDENNKLVGVDTKPISMEANADAQEFTAKVETTATNGFGANYTVKAMLWDSVGGMTPYKYKTL